MTFIDDASRYTHLYFMKHKSEVLEKFKEFVNITIITIIIIIITFIFLQVNLFSKKNYCYQSRTVKVFRTDNGGEYCSTDFVKYLKERGILHHTTTPMNPEQNGVAERMNRTIVETARSMLHHAKLPTSFWAEAVATAVFFRNRSPTIAVSKKTPFECWYNAKPDVSNLKVFGCIANVHIADRNRHKEGYIFWLPRGDKML